MVATKKLKITKDLIGRYVKVRVGRKILEGICVDATYVLKERDFNVYIINDKYIDCFYEDQLIEIGPKVQIPVSY